MQANSVLVATLGYTRLQRLLGLEVNHDIVLVAGAEVELDDVVAFTGSKTAVNCWPGPYTSLNLEVTPLGLVEDSLAWTILMEILAVEGLIKTANQ